MFISLDYFDASINRLAAWAVGMRNAQKALLLALVTPDLKAAQDQSNWTKVMVMNEEYKTLPFGDIWAEYCARQGVPADESWFQTVLDYEEAVLSQRN